MRSRRDAVLGAVPEWAAQQLKMTQAEERLWQEGVDGEAGKRLPIEEITADAWRGIRRRLVKSR